MVVGKLEVKNEEISLISLCIHIASLDAWVNTTYSALVLESVMMGCFLLLQFTVLEPMKYANLDIDDQLPDVTAGSITSSIVSSATCSSRCMMRTISCTHFLHIF